jgi:ribA/ribD-fused uncharacterized protein
MKFSHDEEYMEKIYNAATPREAADLGRTTNRKMCDNWNDAKIVVMYDALLAKFTQHKYLEELLLETGDCVLVEHSKKDSYWGDGGDGSGENMLGRLLMIVRDEIRNG